jgi:Na+-driven multidrug efflux pump
VPYTTYKLMHFFGIFLLMVTLAASSMNALRGGSRADWPWRRALGAAHGIAVFLILLAALGCSRAWA